MKRHLLVDMYKAPKHAQECMRDLSITYQKAVPQSLLDCWWFFNCENIPEELPEWVEYFDIDPSLCIGHGLSSDDVESLKNGVPAKPKIGKPWQNVQIPEGGQKFKAGQIVPNRLKMCFCSDAKGRHDLTFGSDTTVVGRFVYSTPKEGECAIRVHGKGRRMNNGTYKKINWIFRDMHLVVLPFNNQT